MIMLRDDPVVASIERTGYPFWMKDDDDENNREAAREEAFELLCDLEDNENVTDALWDRLSTLYNDAWDVDSYEACIEEFQAVKRALA